MRSEIRQAFIELSKLVMENLKSESNPRQSTYVPTLTCTDRRQKINVVHMKKFGGG